VLSHLTQARIFPNVWALNVNLGDKTAAEAEAALFAAWDHTITIRLMDGDRVWVARPAELGFTLDAAAVVEAARAVGLAGVPFGYSVPPVVGLEFVTAQNYLLNLTESADIAPTNARYALENGEVIGLPGSAGRMLDVPLMMDRLKQDPVGIVQRGRVDLLMQTLPPLAAAAEADLEAARAAAAAPPVITGYDPFTNETFTWSTTREVFVSWLEAGADGLTLRPDTFGAFVEAQNRTLNPTGSLRYLDPRETTERLTKAVRDRSPAVTLRVRYRPTQYTVVGGDTGFRISRKTGIPFYLIEEANPGRDWNRLAIGDVINLPTRDVTLPLPPVASKRIVVNLETQSLMAFEDGRMVFNWLISSGLPNFPTSPGVYQVLSHEDVALGSSFTLCGSTGCGQWEMYWFMGMYEVRPGLMNGFHGAVLLPNGAYLGGGNVGTPYTFGCVMSQNDNAKLLYDWADLGTVVEVIAREFPPQSDLGRVALGGQA
jgi:LysM repeat protein